MFFVVLTLLGCDMFTGEAELTNEELLQIARKVDMGRGHPHAPIGSTWREMHQAHELALDRATPDTCIYVDPDGAKVGDAVFPTAEWDMERRGHNRLHTFRLTSTDPDTCGHAESALVEWYGRAVKGIHNSTDGPLPTRSWVGERIRVRMTLGPSCTITWSHASTGTRESTTDPCPVRE